MGDVNGMVSFDTKGIGERKASFKFKEGTSYQVSLAWFKPQPQGEGLDMSTLPMFYGQRTIYVDKVGFIIPDPKDLDAIIKLTGQEPRLRIGTVLISWPLNRQGEPAKSSLFDAYDVQPWVISEDKFAKLRETHKSYPLNQKDLRVTVEAGGEKFQKIQLLPSPKDGVLYQINTAVLNKTANPEFMEFMTQLKEQILDTARKVEELVGRKMDLATLRARMSGGSSGFGGGGNMPAAQNDVDDLDSTVGSLLD